MFPIYICKNGRRLLILEEAVAFTALDTVGFVPSVVLISAWSEESISLPKWQVFVHEMLQRGCKYFVCVGLYSEYLHDLLDDIIFSEDNHEGIGTTFHNDETLADVAHFFVHATAMDSNPNGGLVAILATNTENDRNLKSLLEQM